MKTMNEKRKNRGLVAAVVMILLVALSAMSVFAQEGGSTVSANASSNASASSGMNSSTNASASMNGSIDSKAAMDAATRAEKSAQASMDSALDARENAQSAIEAIAEARMDSKKKVNVSTSSNASELIALAKTHAEAAVSASADAKANADQAVTAAGQAESAAKVILDSEAVSAREKAQASAAVKAALKTEKEAKLSAKSSADAEASARLAVHALGRSDLEVALKQLDRTISESSQAKAHANAAVQAAMRITLHLDLAEKRTGKEITAGTLRWNKVGNAFEDLTFKIREVLTFNKNSKLELIKERNEKLQERQKEWLELKEEALIQFKDDKNESGKNDKKAVLDSIQREHEAIVKEHLELTSNIQGLHAEARAEGKSDLAGRARATVRILQTSGLGLGLDIGSENQEELNETDSGRMLITEGRAKAVVNSELGFRTDHATVTLDEKANAYVVKGTDEQVINGGKMSSEYTVLVDARTGGITSVDVGARAVVVNDSGGSETSSINKVARVVIDNDDDNDSEKAEAEARVEVRTESNGSPINANSNSNVNVNVGIGGR